MKRTIFACCTVAFMAVAGLLACNSEVKPAPDATAGLSHDEQIARGKYLVDVIGCRDCHSPKTFGPNGPVPDPALDLSGHPANAPEAPYDTTTAKGWLLFGHDLTSSVGPWGISYAANITSDESGIGNWTEAQFIKCIREGKLKGMDNTRPLLPPMPWPNFAKATDEDLKAIFAYLKTTKPVNNVVPAPKMAPR